MYFLNTQQDFGRIVYLEITIHFMTLLNSPESLFSCKPTTTKNHQKMYLFVPINLLCIHLFFLPNLVPTKILKGKFCHLPKLHYPWNCFETGENTRQSFLFILANINARAHIYSAQCLRTYKEHYILHPHFRTCCL